MHLGRKVRAMNWREIAQNLLRAIKSTGQSTDVDYWARQLEAEVNAPVADEASKPAPTLRRGSSPAEGPSKDAPEPDSPGASDAPSTSKA